MMPPENDIKASLEDGNENDMYLSISHVILFDGFHHVVAIDKIGYQLKGETTLDPGSRFGNGNKLTFQRLQEECVIILYI